MSFPVALHYQLAFIYQDAIYLKPVIEGNRGVLERISDSVTLHHPNMDSFKNAVSSHCGHYR